MNTDFGINLVDRYLDDINQPEDATALALAVEEDTELLALLCEYASLEASLQEHLTVSGGGRKQPLVVSFWYRHRAVLCIAAGAAACLALWFFAAGRSGPSESGPVGSPGLVVRRFTGERGRGAKLPLTPPVAVTGGNLVRREFRDLPGKLVKDLNWLSTPSLSTEGFSYCGIPPGERALRFPRRDILSPDSSRPIQTAAANVMFATVDDTNEPLAYGLRSAGVTFPAGASVRWLNGEKQSFEVINTAENLAKIAKMIGNPTEHGPRVLSIIPYLWRIPTRTVAPPAILQERILSIAETEAVLRGPIRSGDTLSALADPSPPSESETRFWLYASSRLLYVQYQIANIRNPEITCVPVQMRQWRSGDVIFVAGLAGTAVSRSDLRAAPPGLESAELEFELTLKDGESAVLHLGPKPDGADWILMLRAGL